MIKKITLRDVASYIESEIEFERDSRKDKKAKDVFIYGMNGAGKSTLSSFLYYLKSLKKYTSVEIQNDRLFGTYFDKEQGTEVKVNIKPNLFDLIYKYENSYCELDNEDFDILVYNRDFVREKFSQNVLTGIISLGADAEIEHEISENERKISELDSRKRALEKSLHSKSTQEGLIELIPSLSSQINMELTALGIPSSLMSDDLNLKSFQNFSVDEERIPDFIELTRRISSLIENDFFITAPEELIEIERAPIWSSDYQISSYINEDIADLLIEDNDNNFESKKQELARAFYIQECKAARNRYKAIYSRLKSQFDSSAIEEIKRSYATREVWEMLSSSADILLFQMKMNLSYMEHKIDQTKVTSPALLYSLIQTEELQKLYNDNVNSFNSRIRLSKKSLDRDTINDIKQYIGNTLKDDIARYQELKEIEHTIEAAIEEADKKADELIEQNVKLRGKKSAVPCDRINKYLELLGIDGYYLDVVPEERGNYKLVRRNDWRDRRPNKYYTNGHSIREKKYVEDSYMSLSEGEKTMLTFVYFIVLCEDYVNAGRKPIIVIDDPISSMSTNFMYNVASLIDDKFTGRIARDKDLYEQVIVLTHNLNFFHEMTEGRVGADKYQSLFKIEKRPEEGSKICKFYKSELSNDYQAYWKVIQDYSEGNYSMAHSAIVGNCMRNILERFFGMTENLSCREMFEDERLSRAKTKTDFSALRRLVNNTSHSDATNQIESSEYGIGHYIDLFEKLFICMGYERHLMTMLNIELDSEEDNNE